MVLFGFPSVVYEIPGSTIKSLRGQTNQEKGNLIDETYKTGERMEILTFKRDPGRRLRRPQKNSQESQVEEFLLRSRDKSVRETICVLK